MSDIYHSNLFDIETSKLLSAISIFTFRFIILDFVL